MVLQYSPWPAQVDSFETGPQIHEVHMEIPVADSIHVHVCDLERTCTCSSVSKGTDVCIIFRKILQDVARATVLSHALIYIHICMNLACR